MSTKRSPDNLLLGEWACLGLLYAVPSHGFAIAAQLRPDAEVGRIWSLSRPLTYRSLDQLVERGLIRPVGSEPGDAGPNRTILAATRTGRARLRTWVRTPVEHLRDLRSELLLKVAIADRCGVAIDDMLRAQRGRLEAQSSSLSSIAFHADGTVADAVALWRYEASQAGLRFLDQLAGTVDDRDDGVVVTPSDDV
jgi:PadR family transcriptional regulator AphA